MANNSRFLILPGHHPRNLATRLPALSERRLARDWRARSAYPPLLLETFVDPRSFRGTSYRVASWLSVGDTRGYRRTRADYSALELLRGRWTRWLEQTQALVIAVRDQQTATPPVPNGGGDHVQTRGNLGLGQRGSRVTALSDWARHRSRLEGTGPSDRYGNPFTAA